MKKILFFLTVFLGLTNSLFAVDLGTHERAKIVQISTTDSLSPNLYQVSYPVELGNNIWLYLDVNSNDVRSYEMVTQLNTSEGSADLYNNVYFNRFNH